MISQKNPVENHLKASQPGSNLVSVQDLKISFEQDGQKIVVVDGVSFDLEAGASLGIIGESGSGKTVTGLAIMGLLPSPPAKIESGTIQFQGLSLLTLSSNSRRKLLGKKIAMIFQEPLTALNPVFTVGAQIVEMLWQHESLTRKSAEQKAIALLSKVGIDQPEKRLKNYPHEFSGGMQQRVMIAMAIACKPDLLIADEPTTALDATVQKQVMDLLKHLQEQMNSALILISHDVGVVKEHVDKIAVMYAGKIVEKIEKYGFEKPPLHPYTYGLFQCSPNLTREAALRTPLPVIEGQVPNMNHLPLGCRFQERCGSATELCFEQEPSLTSSQNQASRSKVACWNPRVAETSV